MAAPGNLWVWREQSILAQRRALGCPPFELDAKPASSGGSPGSSSSSSSSKTGASSSGGLAAGRRAPRHARELAAALRRPPRLAPILAQRAAPRAAPGSPSQLAQMLQDAASPEQLEAVHASCGRMAPGHLALLVARAEQLLATSSHGSALLAVLLERAMQQLQPSLGALSLGELASLAGNLHSLGHHSDAQLLSALAAALAARLAQQASPADIAAAAAAFAQLAAPGGGGGGLIASCPAAADSAFWQQLGRAAAAALPRFSPAQLQQLLSALAARAAGAPDAPLVRAVCGACLQQLRGFSLEEQAQLLLAASSLGPEAQQLLDAAAAEMVGSAEQHQQARRAQQARQLPGLAPLPVQPGWVSQDFRWQA